jgi:hypothetical protein
MKIIALTLFAAALGLAQSDSSSTTPKDTKKTEPTAQNKKAAQPAKPSNDAKANDQKPKAQAQPPLQTIPAGAKEVEPNLYRYTDSNGKTWNYRQTPFGVSRSEETPQAEAQPSSQPNQAKGEPVAVTDLGDSYRFEKQTPFGHSTWVHKKSELTDEEKAIISASAAQDSANTGKPAGNQ